MTEIPEHLLKRSKERRSAIGGDDSPADADVPTGQVQEFIRLSQAAQFSKFALKAKQEPN